MNFDNIKKSLYAALEKLANAERITKATLAEISRDSLNYVVETADIDYINRVIAVLTPMNKAVAIEFFTHFLPWDVEKTEAGAFVRFTTKTKKDKKLRDCAERMKEFLADEHNTIWTWAETNIDIEVKKKDFAGLIVKAITKAMKGDEKSDTDPLTHQEIVKAFFVAGITIDDLMNGIQSRVNHDPRNEEAPANVNEVAEEVKEAA
jgi:hypothetical protein